MCAVICLSINEYHYTQVHEIWTKMHQTQQRQPEEINYTKEKEEEKKGKYLKTKKTRELKYKLRQCTKKRKGQRSKT